MPEHLDSPPHQRLAALRPGMPMAAVAEAVGGAWRPPAPHRGGAADALENSHGLVVYFDRHDAVGSLSFDWRFKQADIAGLRMGMTLAEAREALPAMEVGDDLPFMRGVREGLQTLPDGSVMRVRFTLEKINAISLSAVGAEYAEPYAPPYAAPGGAPGAPFAEVNFKLAVLSSLMAEKALDFGTPAELASHVLGREVDLEDEGYDPIPEALDYLARYPLSDDLLEQVEAIGFDGGNKVYQFVWYFWGGSDESFDVSDITGIERCVNLRRVSATSMLDRLDFARLTSLPRLSRISISVPFDNLQALRELKALEYIRLVDNQTYADVTTPGHPTRELFEALKAKGVTVSIVPSTWKGARPPAFE